MLNQKINHTNNRESDSNSEYILNEKYSDSELIIGLVGAVGTQLDPITNILKDRLPAYNYNTELIEISSNVITQIYCPKSQYLTEYERIKEFMNLGNHAREQSGDNSILALGIASEIMRKRELDEKNQVKPKKRVAYLIKSLKHPEEVERLREIYSSGFFLIGIYSDEKSRYNYLVNDKRMKDYEAKELIDRDADEFVGHGQHTRDTFQMADFFVHQENNLEKVKKSLWRILDLIFGKPFLTPTFDEFAMFMAFISALRTADLSRQVGAVIAKDNEIIASGTNDCPRAGGGLYWPELDQSSCDINDYTGGRDYTIGEDSNKKEQMIIIEDIINNLELPHTEEIKEKLLKSRIGNITEYGRVVHAEMEALLMCSRNNVSTRNATIYCTTFPCHNCAKHIIAAGIKRVVYIEPYPKSKAFEFHADSISEQFAPNSKIVEFIPFTGIGPRRFFELFSMSLGSGYKIIRKDKNGNALSWNPELGRLRTQLLPYSYLDKELFATTKFDQKRRELDGSRST